MTQASSGTHDKTGSQNGASAQVVQDLIASGAVPPEIVEALQDAERRAGEAHDAYLRNLADLDNQRKRLKRTQEVEQRASQERLLSAFLPVWDNLERSLEYSRKSGSVADLAQGVSLTLEQFGGVLQEMGAEPITVQVGEPFDPALHEAVIRDESAEVAAGHVSAVMQAGFRYKERVLRPAKVAVAV